MTDLSPETPEENVAEEAEPDERPDPEEYRASGAAVSESTGTVYDPLGQTETTPHDHELVHEDDE